MSQLYVIPLVMLLLSSCLTRSSYDASIQGTSYVGQAENQERYHELSLALQWKRKRIAKLASRLYLGGQAGLKLWHELPNSTRSQEKAELKFDPADSYLEMRYRSHKLRMGWQTLSWGESLLVSSLDLVNPLDFSRPYSFRLTDRKYSQPLMNYEYGGDLSLQIFAGPSDADPTLPSTIPQQATPEDTAADASWIYGARMGYIFADVELKVYGLKHRRRLPTLFLGTTGLIGVGRPQQSLGMSINGTVGHGLVWRGDVLEARIQNPQLLQTQAAWLPETSERAMSLGFDYTTESQNLMALQYQYQHLGEAHRLLPLVAETSQWATAQYRHSLREGSSFAQVVLLHSLTNTERYGEISWEVPFFSSWLLNLGFQKFDASPQGRLQQLLPGDRVTATVKATL